MAFMHRILTFAAVGALLGDGVAMLVAPKLITWFQSPGVGSAMCNCVEVAQATADTIVKAQGIGLVVGGLAAVISGEVVARLWRRRGGDAPAAPAAPV